MSSSLLNWPSFADRTEPHARKSGQQFDVSFRRTKKDIKKAFERLGVDEWHIDSVTGSSGDPGVVLRWQDGEQTYVAACDEYAAKKANLRALYLWLEETRKAGDRPIKTARGSMAAAALPGGSESEEIAMGEATARNILDVDAGATQADIKEAFREKVKVAHPDQGGSEAELNTVRSAYERLLD